MYISQSYYGKEILESRPGGRIKKNGCPGRIRSNRGSRSLFVMFIRAGYLAVSLSYIKRRRFEYGDAGRIRRFRIVQEGSEHFLCAGIRLDHCMSHPGECQHD